MRGWWLCKPWLGAQTFWLWGSGLQTAPIAPCVGRGKIHPEVGRGSPSSQLPVTWQLGEGQEIAGEGLAQSLSQDRPRQLHPPDQAASRRSPAARR